MIIPSVEMIVLDSVDQAMNHLRSLTESVNKIQKECPYSEINNMLDEVKALFNKTKYKLNFLK